MKKLWGKIRAFLSIILDSLLKQIIVGILVVIIPIEVLTGWITDLVLFIYPWSLDILKSQLMVWHLLIIILVGYFFKKYIYSMIYSNNTVNKHYFMERGDYKWRINRYTGSVDKIPYCITHQIELSGNHEMSCPLCEHNYNISSDISKSYDEVCRIAKAKAEGHLIQGMAV